MDLYLPHPFPLQVCALHLSIVKSSHNWSSCLHHFQDLLQRPSFCVTYVSLNTLGLLIIVGSLDKIQLFQSHVVNWFIEVILPQNLNWCTMKRIWYDYENMIHKIEKCVSFCECYVHLVWNCVQAQKSKKSNNLWSSREFCDFGSVCPWDMNKYQQAYRWRRFKEGSTVLTIFWN